METGPLRIRIGLHSGESRERAGDYFGSNVNTAARVMDLGHGGQILLSDLPEMSVEDALQNAAVELFRQSARRSQPEFEITLEELLHIVQIYRLVYGGILLVAAWVSVLSAAEIAEEISQGLDVLEAEGSELPERQRSVRAVFEQAWSMMSEAEQNVFMIVSVFRGGFTHDAGQLDSLATSEKVLEYIESSSE